MARDEKAYRFEDEIFRAGSRTDIDRLIERLADHELIVEYNGECYLRMETEDILDSLTEAGEIEAECYDD